MVVLDATVVNVALPPIQEDLGFSATGLSWVVSACALAFGGLLLLDRELLAVGEADEFRRNALHVQAPMAPRDELAPTDLHRPLVAGQAR